MIKKYLDDNELFLCCDECMACWRSIDDFHHDKNQFREFNIRSETKYASKKEIEHCAWHIDLKQYIK